MNVDIENSFSVECYCTNLLTSESILLGSNEIIGMIDIQYILTEFILETENFETGEYEIQIIVDPGDNVQELNESNNINSKNRNIYSYTHNHFISSNIVNNAKVITFDFDDEQVGEEIYLGQAVFTQNGELLTQALFNSKSNTSIANLENNVNNQIIQVQLGTSFTPNYIKSIGEPSWQYPITGSSYSHAICDLNNDGYEEVICHIQIDGESYKTICLNYNGDLRWEFDDFADPPSVLFLEPIFGNFNNQNNSIIIMNNGGTLYNIKENSNAEPEIDYSYSIPDCISVSTVPVASDIDKDGKVEIVFIYRSSHGNNINILANYNAANFVGNYSLILDYQSYINPIISDLNNDGESEIIVGQINGGLYIYNMELELLSHILDNNIESIELVSGDINNDFHNDIICQDKILNNHYLRAFDIDGNETFSAFLHDQHRSRWLSDISFEGKINLVCSRYQNMYIVNFPEAGNNIGWPGQRGNLRNTGVLEQPAFFGQFGETVYWMNTISLSEANEIPSGSTVIIKQGTIIKAHSGSSLIVKGNLIAEGTEKNPISFCADISGAYKGYWQGITISNRGNGSFAHCNVNDAEIGILSEDKSNILIKNCYIEKNLKGIVAFNSLPDIKKSIIVNNNVGIGSYKNGMPILSDVKGKTAYRNGIVDNLTNIEIDFANIVLANGYNDIYNISSSGYYINFLHNPGPNFLIAIMNYWGSISVPDIYEQINPPQSVKILPICIEPQSAYNPFSIGADEMLKTAVNNMEEGNYLIAENTFKAIIYEFPETQEAYFSVGGLFECTDRSGGSFSVLEDYYNELYNDSTLNFNFIKLVFGYINLSKREQEKYNEAIENYESIILNNTSYNDSVYAVIDIGNTYEEAGLYKSTLGKLSFLKPLSTAKHVEKSVDLLLSLKTEQDKKDAVGTNKINIEMIYPNPFYNQTTIRFNTNFSCNLEYKIFDATGKLVIYRYLGKTLQGSHNIALIVPHLVSGVYYLTLIADGSSSDYKKLIVQP
jgi:tetratricopeptide (TPR) repeat protein